MTEAQFRRVVTGHDAEGRAIIQQDRPVPRVQRVGGEHGPLFFKVWNTRETPAPIDRASGEPAEHGIQLAAIADWDGAERELRALFVSIAGGGGLPVDPGSMCAPLPRSWQWLDGSPRRPMRSATADMTDGSASISRLKGTASLDG